MDRAEMLKKLGEIKVIATNMVVTYDMGIQFDVMTDKGVCTNVGNIGNWPCYKLPVTPEYIVIKERLCKGEEVSVEDILNVSVCKDLLTYTDMFHGTDWVVGGDKLDKCIEHLKVAIKSFNTERDYLYAFVDLEDWGENEIKFFNECEALNNYFGEIFGCDYDLYVNMDDKSLQQAYEEAEESDWDGVPYKDLCKD